MSERAEIKFTEDEYRDAISTDAIYDAGEYLVAGLDNQAEWWEHLGDAHRDYRALAEAVAVLEREQKLLREQLAAAIAQDYCTICGKSLATGGSA